MECYLYLQLVIATLRLRARSSPQFRKHPNTDIQAANPHKENQSGRASRRRSWQELCRGRQSLRAMLRLGATLLTGGEDLKPALGVTKYKLMRAHKLHRKSGRRAYHAKLVVAEASQKHSLHFLRQRSALLLRVRKGTLCTLECLVLVVFQLNQILIDGKAALSLNVYLASSD